MKKNHSIQIFQSSDFGTIRTLVNETGETFFVGSDVARALGYSNTRKALQDHVDKEDKGVTKRDTLGGPQRMTIINESGLYSLILSSQLPSAKAFKRWVTSEVLPQIRKTGGYIPTKDARTGEPLSEKQIIRTAEEIMQKTISMKNLPADRCFTTSDIANGLNITANELNHLLVDWGVQFWSGSRYRLTKEYSNKGYTQDRIFHYYALNGSKRERTYMVWTLQGLNFISQLFSGR